MSNKIKAFSLIAIVAISIVIAVIIIPKNSDNSKIIDLPYESSISDIASGKQLLELKCNICHAIKDTHEAMLAPPFNHIQSKYSKVYKTKDNFVSAIVSFTAEPNKENAIMFGALKQFEVMPKLAYSQEDLKLIAEYIYSGEFEKPKYCNP